MSTRTLKVVDNALHHGEVAIEIDLFKLYDHDYSGTLNKKELRDLLALRCHWQW
eukprot:SAG11_NODE_599_length_8269_cov_3.455080_6_plen_54_part_00